MRYPVFFFTSKREHQLILQIFRYFHFKCNTFFLCSTHSHQPIIGIASKGRKFLVCLWMAWYLISFPFSDVYTCQLISRLSFNIFCMVKPVRYFLHLIIHFPIFGCFLMSDVSWLVKSLLDFFKLLV